MLTEQQRSKAANLLSAAEIGRQAISPLSDRFPGLDIDDAYAIQSANVEAKVAEGQVIVGHKVGLSSEAMQRTVGVFEPDFGHLLDGMILDTGAEIDRERFLQPRIEPEIAFVLSSALRGPGVTISQVLRATEYVVPALEIVDSRIRDWNIKIGDTIADNASSGGVVLGVDGLPPDRLDLVTLPVAFSRNGEVIDHGVGAAVLGHPAASVAWLANKLAPYGVALEAGHLVMPGSFTAMITVAAGDTITADFAGLGMVTANFAKDDA